MMCSTNLDYKSPRFPFCFSFVFFSDLYYIQIVLAPLVLPPIVLMLIYCNISTVSTFVWTGELLGPTCHLNSNRPTSFSRCFGHAEAKNLNIPSIGPGRPGLHQFSQVSYDSLGRLWKLSTGECVHVSLPQLSMADGWTLRDQPLGDDLQQISGFDVFLHRFEHLVIWLTRINPRLRGKISTS